jgi:SAM-dependent methyltransferase
MEPEPRSRSELRRWLQHYYGEVLQRSDDLATNACCAAGAPPPHVAEALARVHERVLERFYGCGFPIPEALEGATVLDLGCGAGRDAYVLAQLVGPKGRVIGLDMTPAQLAVARETLAWHMERFGHAEPNVDFREGFIEDLAAAGVADASVDVVVSNCVVNLSPAPERVLAEVHRVLRPGGELHVSDVVADRRLPPEVARDPLLQAECLGGALYEGDLDALARRTGFGDPRCVASAPIQVQSADVQARVGAARFRSTTLRLFKLDGLDDRCEDYGQLATYRGGLPGAEARFVLDDHHVFEAGRPERVCGNTAAMLSATRLAPWFRVDGDRSVHHGRFPCAGTLAQGDAAGSAGSCC